MRTTFRNVRRIVRFIDRRAWSLRRGGGLVIGMAWLGYAVSVPVAMAVRAMRRVRAVPVVRMPGGALHPRV